MDIGWFTAEISFRVEEGRSPTGSVTDPMGPNSGSPRHPVGIHYDEWCDEGPDSGAEALAEVAQLPERTVVFASNDDVVERLNLARLACASLGEADSGQQIREYEGLTQAQLCSSAGCEPSAGFQGLGWFSWLKRC